MFHAHTVQPDGLDLLEMNVDLKFLYSMLTDQDLANHVIAQDIENESGVQRENPIVVHLEVL